MQLKDYTHQLNLNPNNVVGRRLLGEIRLTNKQGKVTVKASFKSINHRKVILENWQLLHGKKIESGELILSYLLD